MKRNARLLLLVAIVVLSGCGGGSQQTTPPAIVVTLSTPPPTSLAGGRTSSVAATVTNDSANAGVQCSCTPSPPACGSFTSTSTASGANTTYVAPAVAPAGGSAVLIATSVTDVTKNAQSAPVRITGTASNASLNGQYVFYTTAPTGALGNSIFVGSLTLDGNGNITGGEEELVSPMFSDSVDLITTGSNYSIDPNGHGTMKINTVNGETLRLSFVLTSPSHALIVETDGDPSSGTLDLQQHAGSGFALSQISGEYSFVMDGQDNTGALNEMSVGGIFNADGNGSLSGGTLDMNNGGTFTTTSAFIGSFTAPDPSGRGTMIWVADTGRSFVYYILSPKVLRL